MCESGVSLVNVFCVHLWERGKKGRTGERVTDKVDMVIGRGVV